MSNSIKGTQTEQNLLKAFAGESQARNRYEFAAKVAKKEGYEQIAAIFQETANQEKEHAKRFFKFLEDGEGVEFTAMYPAGKIGTTMENLKAAAEGENEEWTELYPKFAEIAEQEGFKEVAVAFKMIAKVEAEHERRYLKLLQNLSEDKVFMKDGKVWWKCLNCGYVYESEKALEKCPACLHPQSYMQVREENY
jgi:rubrerythrin